MIVFGSSEGAGTVYSDCARGLFSNVNLTACSTSRTGSGIEIPSVSTEFVCLYFGGMNLRGVSVIDSSSTSSKSTVSHSQFYENEVGLSGAVLYGRGNGFVVSNTQFKSNSNPIMDIRRYVCVNVGHAMRGSQPIGGQLWINESFEKHLRQTESPF
jgi:hypothetical protein